MEAVYVAAKTNKSPLRPKESTETKMLFQCDVMLMIASPKEDNFRFSLLVTLQSKRCPPVMKDGKRARHHWSPSISGAII